MKYLDKINSPSDVKKLDKKDLPELAKECREVLIETVSKNGGHLASNLGVVELTIALHRVFCSPKDKIIWDVGHQCYTHKLLTGRYNEFSTIRTENGLSGFTKPDESEHDLFYSGHSSVSISQALGLATANSLKNEKNTTVAVIGDGAFTGGLAYEALNNAGRVGKRLIVILNDNEMSISKNVGSVARYLAVIRSSPRYYKLKENTEKALNKIPLVGAGLSELVYKLKTRLKNMIYKSTFFEDLGFRYMGPIDGHNIDQLCEALESAKMIKDMPVLLHINTIKGKGYDFAEKDPSEFHGVSKFNINTGEPIYSGKNFSSEFGRLICDMAHNDKRICAVTAAMALGTGLNDFSLNFPERFFDVGIAEEHAVTFCAGLAKGGMLPVFSVYSTFLQRCFDQVVHDGTMQNLHMILAIDRAGFVGEDGVSHHGITVFSPTTYEGLRQCLVRAAYHTQGVVAVRYPRGEEKPIPENIVNVSENYDIYGNIKAKNYIVTYGRIFSHACTARDLLIKDGRDFSVIRLNRIKPIDRQAVGQTLGSENIYFFEEGIKNGGIGETFGELLAESSYKGNYRLTAVDNHFVRHAPVSKLYEEYMLDADGMYKICTEK